MVALLNESQLAVLTKDRLGENPKIHGYLRWLVLASTPPTVVREQ